jgi:hypothetical protein
MKRRRLIMDILASKTIEEAWANLGTEEIPRGSNWGKYVKAYLKSVGINYPASWCAAFVYYRISTAAKELGITTKFIKTASCQAMYQWAKKNNHILDAPEDGCVFLQWHQELHRYAHTGFVKSYSKTTNKFVSIEGNSNSDGSREGYCVASNKRTVTPGKYVFVKIV